MPASAQGRTKGIPGMGSVPKGVEPPKASQAHAGQRMVTSNTVTPGRGAAETLREPEMLEARGRLRLPWWDTWWCPGRAGPEARAWGHAANPTHTG